MKITDEEREAAYELKWMVDGILFERERAILYRDVYLHIVKSTPPDLIAVEFADKVAREAIRAMEKAFQPVCETCQADQEAAIRLAN